MNPDKSLPYFLAMILALAAAPSGKFCLFVAGANGKSMHESSPDQSKLTVHSRFSHADFIPDGNLQKEIWQRAEWAKLDRDAFNQKPLPEAETLTASVWTTTHVYFASPWALLHR